MLVYKITCVIQGRAKPNRKIDKTETETEKLTKIDGVVLNLKNRNRTEKPTKPWF